MKVALIGATGFIGSQVLKELVSRGHVVTAISRNPEKVAADESVKSVKGDAFDVAEIASLTAGHDAVVSAYNAGWSNPDIYNDFLKGSKAIQAGVKQSGVKRILIFSGAGSLEVAPGLQLIDTPDFPEEYKPGASAARDYFNELKEETEPDWTYLSPSIERHPGTSGVRTGAYQTALNNPVFDEQGRSKISVEDLSVAIADEIEQPKFVKQRFTVGQ